MTRSRWLRSLGKRLRSVWDGAPRPVRPRHTYRKLRLELLEDRTLLSFAAALNFPTGFNPNSVAVADFNRDGKLDIASANYSSSSVSILLGNGDGTLQGPVNYGTGNNTQGVAVGDFNGDGNVDIAATNVGGNTVSILLGNGDGTFQPAANYSTGSAPVAVAVGDLNGDGKLDLVTANNGADSVSVLLGNGDGTFQPRADYAVGNPNSVALADFNNDGKLDVVVADGNSNGVSVLAGNGDGTLRAPATARTDSGPSSVAAADLNGDGKADLVVANFGSSDVQVFLGNGDGTFQNPLTYATGAGPHAAGVADYNGDGKPDLAVANYWSNTVSVFLGKGDGTFLGAATVGTDAQPYSAVPGDFNGDGRPDLVTGNWSSDDVSVLLNDGAWPRFDTLVVAAPAQTVAGASFTFTVTARDSSGAADAGYTGTVHFTSSDTQATLPSEYTFTAADQGSHTFSAVLRTAGTQSLTASDTAGAFVVAGQQSIAVSPAAVSGLLVAGFPSPVVAGSVNTFSVTAVDPFGNTATSYAGTVHFSSSDGQASLPANYTFTASDQGSHTFSAVLRTAGTQSLTASDTATAAITGSQQGVTVNPAQASVLRITGLPSAVQANVAYTFTVTVLDAFGNVATGYRGTLHFSSTDARASLPADYTFTATDAGSHVFGVVFQKRGRQTLQVTDILDAGLTTKEAVLVRA